MAVAFYNQMMVSGLRALLFWLLLVALPLHGFTASALRGCDAMSMVVSQTSAALSADTPMAVGLESTSAKTASQSSSVCSDMTETDQQSWSSNHSTVDCAGSAACSMVAAATMPNPEIFVPLPASAPPVSRPVSAAGFLTDAPDRPPRVLA